MKKYCSLALSLILAVTVVACDDSPTAGGGEDTGSMSLLITDAPGDFERAIVTIERVELLRGDDDDIDDIEDDAGDDDNRVILVDEPWTGDLLELSNDVAELADDVTVPGGAYHQLRIIISGGCIEVETVAGSNVYASDGYTECGDADGQLQMPSFAQSGLKVRLPSGFRIDGDHRIVLIDFDVSDSFGHPAGNSGRWVMHPSIEATEVELSGRLDVSLIVADSVELPDAITVDSFSVRLEEEPGVPVVDGVAAFDFLLPGTYSIDLVAPEGITVTTDPELPLEIDVGSASNADATITITSVTTS